MKHKTVILASAFVCTLALAGCKEPSLPLSHAGKAQLELPAKIQSAMKAENMAKNSPIMVRIFKEESQLEIWKQRRDGKYGLIATYDICKWSGKLGPKYVEGDRQAPEGFYTVRPHQMNPNSQYYLSFNIGFPNAYDRVNGRTGKHLMVHGACSSAGCYSMSDENIAEIYAFGRDSFKGGQQEFQIHAFPFRMTSANMARYRDDANYPFWLMLKEGYDLFEASQVPPRVDVCEKRYVFNRTKAGDAALVPDGSCPAPMGGMVTNAYTSEMVKKSGVFAAVTGLTQKGKAAAPTIQGVAEARLVADWSHRRKRGEKVSATPPSLLPSSAETAGAPDVVVADDIAAPVIIPPAKPQAVRVEAAEETPPEGIIKKKKGWSLFGGKKS